MDVVVTIFLMGTVGVIFASTFPNGFSASKQAREYKVATGIAQRKMEQLRALKYESLTYAILQSNVLIDPSPVSPTTYAFTQTDNVTGSLPQGSGTIDVSDVPGTQIRKVVVSVRWSGPTGVTRAVQLTTFFADRRPRPGS